MEGENDFFDGQEQPQEPQEGYNDFGNDYSSMPAQSYDPPAMDNGMGNMGYASLDAPQSAVMPDPEPANNALGEFMAQWEARLREKAAVEKQKEADAKEAARNDRNKFVADRGTMREAKMAQNRTQEQVFLEQLEADLESDNPWERVVSLVDMQADLAQEFQDTGRMRSIFIQLKNDPLERPTAGELAS